MAPSYPNILNETKTRTKTDLNRKNLYQIYNN